jgi:hypothetical protein
VREAYDAALAAAGIARPKEAFNRWLFECRGALTVPLVNQGRGVAATLLRHRLAAQMALVKLTPQPHASEEPDPQAVADPSQWPSAVTPTQQGGADPLIPSAASIELANRASGGHSTIEGELLRDGAPASAVARVIAAVEAAAARQSAELWQETAPLSHSSLAVSVSSGTGDIVQLTVRRGAETLAVHELLRPYWLKLRTLFQRSRTLTTSLSSGELNADDEKQAALRLAALLTRYRAAAGARPNEGSGHHSAVPGEVMDVLHRRLGVTVEGFASPLNCYFDTYCSAFDDVDGFFGSLGSFFDIEWRQGVIEVNPPFVEEVMEPVRVRMLELLEKANCRGDQLSFILVVPDWRVPITPCIAKLEATPKESFLRRAIRVDKERHCYFDGFQHCLRESYYRPVHHTMLYVLQTDGAAAKWPVTDAVVDEVLKMWATVAERCPPNPLTVMKAGERQQGTGESADAKRHRTEEAAPK